MTLTEEQVTAAAARVVVLDKQRDEQADRSSTASKKAVARLQGALQVWEALTGLPYQEALTAAYGRVGVPQ